MNRHTAYYAAIKADPVRWAELQAANKVRKAKARSDPAYREKEREKQRARDRTREWEPRREKANAARRRKYKDDSAYKEKVLAASRRKSKARWKENPEWRARLLATQAILENRERARARRRVTTYGLDLETWLEYEKLNSVVRAFGNIMQRWRANDDNTENYFD